MIIGDGFHICPSACGYWISRSDLRSLRKGISTVLCWWRWRDDMKFLGFQVQIVVRYHRPMPPMHGVIRTLGSLLVIFQDCLSFRIVLWVIGRWVWCRHNHPHIECHPIIQTPNLSLLCWLVLPLWLPPVVQQWRWTPAPCSVILMGEVCGDVVYCRNDIARLARYRVTTLLYRTIGDGRNIPLIRVL